MAVTPTYPGVYIEEISSGVHTITGVATSITAFIGRAISGPVSEPCNIYNFGDFERLFGGLDYDFPMSYAVRDFYINGGSQAVVVRLAAADAVTAKLELLTEVAATPLLLPAPQPAPDVPTAGDVLAEGEGKKEARPSRAQPPAHPEPLQPAKPPLTLLAASPGSWGNNVSAQVDHTTRDHIEGRSTHKLFNLTVREHNADGTDRIVERHLNVSVDEASPRYVARVLEQDSALVRVATDADGDYVVPGRPIVPTHPQDAPLRAVFKSRSVVAAGGSDGASLQANSIIGDEASKTGLYALEKTDLFNLLCIPPDVRDEDTDPSIYQEALAYCVRRRAMLIVDPPAAWGENKEMAAQKAVEGLDELGISGTQARNAVLYFPRVKQADPKLDNKLDTFVPCGIVAGIMAKTDAQRGVWKAPAGLDAALLGIRGLEVNLTDLENGTLNELGINCLRSFPVYGTVVWGARTMRGADRLTDEYKYLPVRRTVLFLEESLYRATQWVVFEPNDEPLWSQIRLNIGAFMNTLFRQGAFQGKSARDAYFVKCDSETTTQNDINLGRVNVVVGFAPLKPAEFVIIQIQQMTGNIQV